MKIELSNNIVTWSTSATRLVAALFGPVEEDVAGALEIEEEALGVGAAGAGRVLGVISGTVEEEALGVGAAGVDRVLGVISGAAEEEAPVVGAAGVDGVLGVTSGAVEEETPVVGAAGADGVFGASMGSLGVDTVGVEATGEDGPRVTEGAGDKDVLGVAAVYVTFFTTLRP